MRPETGTIVANGDPRVVELPCLLSVFLAGCGFKATQVIVEHNGKVLTRKELGRTTLHDGDQIEVIVPVAGG